MGQRVDLHNILVDVLGTTSVYFQPPETIKMKYPCIVYDLNNIDSHYADDAKYASFKSYNVTVIDKDPDSLLPDKLGELPYSSFNRHFVSDNLHHFTFKIYY